jgi:phenylacetate-CoA ligase
MIDVLKLTEFLSGYSFRREITRLELLFSENPDNFQRSQLQYLFNELKNNDYYGNFFNKKVHYERIDPILFLKDMPFLDKQIINRFEKKILKKRVSEKLVKIQTSGSSGVKGFTYLSQDELMRNRSIQLMWWMWGGYIPGCRTVQLGVNRKRSLPKAVKDTILNIDYQLAFGQTEEQIYNSLLKYKNGKLPFLAGYASSLYLYALVAEKYKMNISVDSSISWGDKLFDHFKELIKSSFGCRVFDTYGSSEGFNIAGECYHGNLHVTTPHIYLEILDKEGKSVEPGTLGEAVVTRLDACHFPMIRYRIGDLLIMEPESYICDCGRRTPIIRQVIGRDTDIIYYDGGFLTVQVIVFILKQYNEIVKWQVVQKKNSDLIVKLVVSEEFDKLNELLIIDSLSMSVQNKLKVSVEYTQEINFGGVGKPKLVVSELMS